MPEQTLISPPEEAAPPVRSLRSLVAWLAVGNGVYLACQYGMLVAIARLGSQTAVGHFALALAISAPVVIFSQMQFRQLQVTDALGDEEFVDYFWTRLWCTAGALVVVDVIAAVLYEGEVAMIIAIVALAKGFESMSDVVYGDLQRRERMRPIAFSMMARAVLSLAALGAVLALTGSLLGGVAALAGVWALVFFVYDLPVQRRIGSRRSPRGPRGDVMKRLVRVAAPLALASGLISLSGNLPRYFLDARQGPEAVALFSVAAMPLVLVNLFVGAAGQGILPRAALHLRENRFTSFSRLAVRLTAIQVGLGLVLAAFFWLVGEELIVFLFSVDYAPASSLLVVLALGTAVAGFGAYGALLFTAGRRFILQFGNVAVMVLAQGALCYALIGPRGLAGAGWAEVGRYAASTIFLLLAGWGVTRQTFRPHPRFGDAGSEAV